jgi:hypothetical protein
MERSPPAGVRCRRISIRGLPAVGRLADDRAESAGSDSMKEQVVDRRAARSRVRPRILPAELAVIAAMLIVLSSLHVTWSGWELDLAMQTAAAKDGNGNGSGGGGGNGGGKGKGSENAGRAGDVAGDGKGRGNGKGSDNGGDSGKAGDNAGGGESGNSGGKNTANGETSTSDDEDTASDSGQRDVRSINPMTGAQVTIRGKSIEVLHRNGMSESVKGGRYLMKDDKGRTIAERSATKADVRRLENLKG